MDFALGFIIGAGVSALLQLAWDMVKDGTIGLTKSERERLTNAEIERVARETVEELETISDPTNPLDPEEIRANIGEHLFGRVSCQDYPEPPFNLSPDEFQRVEQRKRRDEEVRRKRQQEIATAARTKVVSRMSDAEFDKLRRIGRIEP